MLLLLTKTWRMMRILSFLLFIFCLQVSATGTSQTVTFSGKKVPLSTVFRVIKQQTGYQVFSNSEALLNAKPVTIQSNALPLNQFLIEVLKDQHMVFEFKGRTIAIGKKTPLKISPLFAPPPITVRGRIVNEKNDPVIASVIIKETNRGTTSSANGDFELSNVDEHAVLVITATNIEPVEIKVGGRTSIIVNVQSTSSQLSEVVINKGYYNTSKKLNTGSVSKVEGETVQRHPIVNPVQALQGRVTGAYVQQTTGVPGGAFNILIRGQNSMANGNDPLYIVDGVPFGATTLSAFNASDNILPDANPLNVLNPSDIESIEILKDADATAIYGSRGANGVVLITTVKGKAGKAQVDVNMNHGVGHNRSKLQLLNTEQYIAMRKEAFANDGTTPGVRDYDVNGTWDQNRYTDWNKELTGGTAQMTNAQLGISGGTATTQYILSGGYYRETTVFPGNNSYKKGTGKLSLTHQSVNKKLRALISVNYAIENNNLIPYDLSMFSNLSPNAPALYDENGQLNWENGTWSNPLAILRRKFNTVTDNIIANASISYELYPGLFLRTNMGYTKGRRDEVNANPLASYSPFSTVTDKTISSHFADTRSMTWILEPQISWERKMASSKLSVLAGATMQENLSEGERLRGIGFSTDAFTDQLTAANSIVKVSGTYSQYKYTAGFARINYDWKNTYIINVTGRRDGSSRFGNNRQFANFGAIGAAWIFSNESFIEKVFNNVLSLGKLRMSYGTTGNDQIGDYNYLETWSTTTTYEGRTGLYPTRIANPLYGWEVNKKAEAGLELGLLNNNIMLSVAYYRNRSSNQLVSEPLPPSVGFTSLRANLPAVVQNTGWEVEINTTNFRSRNFSWSTAFNITIPRNKLIGFPNLASSIYARSYIIGEPLEIRRLYNTSVDPLSGEYVFEDYDKSGDRTEDDRYVIKNSNQQYYGGLDNSIIWKGWKLDFLFQFVKQEGTSYMASYDMPGQMMNQPIDVLQRWQNPNDITNVQKYSANTSSTPYLYARSAGNTNVADASFVRLKNLSLSFSMPDHWVKKIGMKQVRIKMQGLNLFTFSSYKWSDPESQNSFRLPPLRQLNAGVQLSM